MQIPDIKKRLPITKVLAHYNIKINKHNHIKCPFHADEKPSCKIYTDTNTYNCFGCGKTGDVIQFIQDKENYNKHEALTKAVELIGETKKTDVMGIASKKAVQVETENFAELFTKQKDGLPRSPKALAYLKSRGLENLNEVGYNSGISWKKLKQCITFPLKDKKGDITSLYGRRIIQAKTYTVEVGKHFYSEHRKGLHPHYPPQETETLIITEAIIDAASLLQIEELQSITILSAYGTNGLTKEHTKAINQLPNLQEVIFFFDGDKAGGQSVAKYSEEFSKQDIKTSIVCTPPKEDVNSLWVNYGKEAILQLIEERSNYQPDNEESEPFFSIEKTSNERKEISKIAPEINESETLTQQTKTSPLNTDTPNKIIYQTQTARYIIKGILCKQLDKMLVSLDVQCLETATKYRCRLDLYEEKQTRKEAREASEKLDLRSDLVENDLSQLTDQLEVLRDNQLQQQTMQESNHDKSLSSLMESKCKSFLRQEGLIDLLNWLIGKSGPMASICATTHGSIYEDNMSRMFIVAVDESSEQTQRIMSYQSKAASGIVDKEQENEAQEFLQNCIRMLKPQKVINPYADKITLPPQAHKIRRLHELFLSFVKQVTLINQYSRKRDKQGRIVTEPEDLQTAVEIMFDSIFLKVDELDGSLRQFFESLKEYILEKENSQNYEFTQREIRHALHLSKTQLFRYLNELIELEYLQQSGGYANKGFKYKISYWDNITKLRTEIREYLFDQIKELAFRDLETQDGTLETV